MMLRRDASIRKEHRVRLVSIVLLVSALVLTPLRREVVGGLERNTGFTYLSGVMHMEAVSLSQARGRAKLAQAERWLRAALKVHPDNRSSWWGLGFLLTEQGRQSEAAEAWQRAGATAQHFIAVGQEARKAGHYQYALVWYKKAARVAPELGDPWYYQGLTYESMGEWTNALLAYKASVGHQAWDAVGLSTAYYRLGIILQWREDLRDLPQASEAYRKALTISDFTSAEQRIDALVKYVQTKEWLGESIEDDIDELEQAESEAPTNVAVLTLLGAAYYEADDHPGRAVSKLQHAIQRDPTYKWAYVRLVNVHLQEGDQASAFTVCKKLLEALPDDPDALELMRDLRSKTGY